MVWRFRGMQQFVCSWINQTSWYWRLICKNRFVFRLSQMHMATRLHKKPTELTTGMSTYSGCGLPSWVGWRNTCLGSAFPILRGKNLQASSSHNISTKPTSAKQSSWVKEIPIPFHHLTAWSYLATACHLMSHQQSSRVIRFSSHVYDPAGSADGQQLSKT